MSSLVDSQPDFHDLDLGCAVVHALEQNPLGDKAHYNSRDLFLYLIGSAKVKLILPCTSDYNYLLDGSRLVEMRHGGMRHNAL
jgi:hypothetical protein